MEEEDGEEDGEGKGGEHWFFFHLSLFGKRERERRGLSVIEIFASYNTTLLTYIHFPRGGERRGFLYPPFAPTSKTNKQPSTPFPVRALPVDP